jgi:hypothetical protein
VCRRSVGVAPSLSAALALRSNRELAGEATMAGPLDPFGDAVVIGGWRRWLHNAVEAPTLGQFLLRHNRITDQQLARALAIQRLSGERLGHVLVRSECLTETELTSILNRQHILRWLARLLG